MTLICLKNIYKTYKTNAIKVEALKNINLNVEEGEFLAIVGSSGSGKSTLLNILGCLDKASNGNYLLNSQDINLLKPKELAMLRNKTFGFIVQYFALINDYTVYENIQIPLEYSKVPSSKRKEKIVNTLERLKILDKVKATPSELSGGQNQRVAIARALINDPKIILADEPTGALDSKTSQEIMDIFKALNKEGKTVVIITHDFKIASQCNRIIHIEDGMIIKDEINGSEDSIQDRFRIIK